MSASMTSEEVAAIKARLAAMRADIADLKHGTGEPAGLRQETGAPSGGSSRCSASRCSYRRCSTAADRPRTRL
jgi:hypothetical protein